jgi:hypothetical protein
MADEVHHKMELLSRATARYKEMQLEAVGDYNTENYIQAKYHINKHQAELNATLDATFREHIYHGVSDKDWADNYAPFHWVAEFYSIIVENGGFDVIIGNPPYLEERQIDYNIKGFATSDSKAVHVYCIERAYALLHESAAISMIVPMALVSTQRMKSIRKIIETKRVYYSNYSWRPGKLFDEVNRALTIFVAISGHSNPYTTSYIKWYSQIRETLIDTLHFTLSDNNFADSYWIGKIGNYKDNSLLNKLGVSKKPVSHILARNGANVFYKTTGGLYWKVFTDFAPKFFENGIEGHSSRETSISVENSDEASKLVALLSSSLYWWWYTLTSNLRDLNPSDITNFYLPPNWDKCSELIELGQKYINDLCKNSSMLERNQKGKGLTAVQSFKISLSKPIIDQIDTILAQHYGFTEEELDYIINYDIKYRMGISGGGESDEE